MQASPPRSAPTFREAGLDIFREAWPVCPDEMFTVLVHSYSANFERERSPGLACWPTQTSIFFPREEFRLIGPYSWDPTISLSAIQNYGWAIIKGLSPNDVPNMTGGFTLTVKYYGQNLVPPPGLWPYTLPVDVKHGEVEPSEEAGWFDIFDINQGFLAWSDGVPPSRVGWSPYDDEPAYRFVEIGPRGKWWFHASEEGLHELLEKMYPGHHRIKGERFMSQMSIWLPGQDLGFWIGAQGHNAKQLAQWLGVKYIRFQSI